MMITVNGQNYFNKASFEEICKVLESGKGVKVYIDCIGHTRNNDEQENYKSSLIEKYGDKLICRLEDGYYSYSYSYELKK